jgi:DNA-binding MarR family transcriptional regulator
MAVGISEKSAVRGTRTPTRLEYEDDLSLRPAPLGPEEAAYLNIQRTAETLAWKLTELLRPSGITATQYNVLRILRSAGSCGLACSEIAERMVTRDSDVTRLLDRMEKMGLITRCREQRDRRVVTTCVTSEASRLLEELDGPVARLMEELLGGLGGRRLNILSDLLELARQNAG